jgi:hypothetical protein
MRAVLAKRSSKILRFDEGIGQIAQQHGDSDAAQDEIEHGFRP